MNDDNLTTEQRTVCAILATAILFVLVSVIAAMAIEASKGVV